MKPLETSISVSFVLMQTVLLVTMNTGYSNSIVCARQRRRADGTCLPEYVSAYKQKQSPKLTTDSSSEAVVRNINAMIFMPNPNDSSINLDDQEMRAAALMAIDRVEKEGLISPKRYIWKKENFNFAPVGCDERKSLLQVHSWFSGQLQQNGTVRFLMYLHSTEFVLNLQFNPLSLFICQPSDKWMNKRWSSIHHHLFFKRSSVSC